MLGSFLCERISAPIHAGFIPVLMGWRRSSAKPSDGSTPAIGGRRRRNEPAAGGGGTSRIGGGAVGSCAATPAQRGCTPFPSPGGGGSASAGAGRTRRLRAEDEAVGCLQSRVDSVAGMVWISFALVSCCPLDARWTADERGRGTLCLALSEALELSPKGEGDSVRAPPLGKESFLLL
jgi:hypothetical protein